MRVLATLTHRGGVVMRAIIIWPTALGIRSGHVKPALRALT